jgi:sRNA-binding regulator protein Hfq
MRKLLFVLLISVSVAPISSADTIHLKNGSILKGKVTSFADDQFVVMLDTGSGRYMSRAMVYIGDVARIEFDSASGMSSDAGSMRDTPTRDLPARDTARDTPVRDTNTSILPGEPPRTSRDTHSRDTQPRNTQPAEPRDASPADAQPTPSQPRDTAPSQPDRPTIGPDRSSPSVVPTADSSDTTSRKPAGPVRTATIDVAGKRDWTSTGLIIKRGDRIRITATGSVTLDPLTGRATGPDGMSEIVDSKKLLPDQPTGALIGVIGADNDDFIFIGRSNEFTATRDGLLFLSVNEGSLSDNTGSFKAVIEVQRR